MSNIALFYVGLVQYSSKGGNSGIVVTYLH